MGTVSIIFAVVFSTTGSCKLIIAVNGIIVVIARVSLRLGLSFLALAHPGDLQHACEPRRNDFGCVVLVRPVSGCATINMRVGIIIFRHVANTAHNTTGSRTR